MATNKTTEKKQSVTDFINALAKEPLRKDCFELIAIMSGATGAVAKMWGSSIIGFGRYHYKYESGHEGDAPIIAFAPRATSIAIYVSGNFDGRESLLAALGKHKTNKGCVHIKKLSDVNVEVLKEMVEAHIKHTKAMYP